MINASRLQARAQAFATSPLGRRVLKGLRFLVVGGIMAYLVYQLTQMGWGEFWRSLPTTPYFYLTVALMYLTLPLAEVLIYGRLWAMPVMETASLMMRKRVLNADLVGYSGEVFLLAHARKRLDRPTRQIAGEIKDSLILSSVASITTACLILVGLLAMGYVAVGALVDQTTPAYVALGGLAFVMVVGLFVRFRKAIFTLGSRTLVYVLGIHFLRFAASTTLQVVQWWVVLPDAPFSAWATLLVIFVAMNRIPFIPSRDLAFAGVGIEASAALGVPVPVVAGMLLTRSAIDRVLNFGLFALLSARDRTNAFEIAEDLRATDFLDGSKGQEGKDTDGHAADREAEAKPSTPHQAAPTPPNASSANASSESRASG